MDKILIIDGHGLAHRAFHAMEGRDFTAPDGTPTGMILGFTNMLARALDDVKPRCCTAVFDAHGPTFRHEMLPQYKANRQPSPPEMRQQMPVLQELLKLMGCPVIARQGVEADDVIASLALAAAKNNLMSVILSSDKDLMQMLGPGIDMLRPIKRGISEAQMLNAASFEAEYGFAPSSMPDYLALLGDTADNVPGVSGIGEKGAKQLISQYKTLENLFNSLDALKAGTRKKLEEGKETAFASRELIRLKLDVPVGLEECLSFAADIGGAIELASRLRLSKVERRLREKGDVFVQYPSFAEVSADAESDPAPRHPRMLVKDAKALIKQGLLNFNNFNDIWDFRTAYYLLHPDTARNDFPKLLPEDFKGPVMSDAPETDPAVKALFENLDREIGKYRGLRAVMEEIDLPLLPVLDRMERWGVRLDIESFAGLQGELDARIENIEEEISTRAGEEINLNSPKQVSELLFEKMGFEPQKKTKGKSSYSTDAAVLERLSRLPDGKVPCLILEHRELSKIRNGYVIPLQKAAGDGQGCPSAASGAGGACLRAAGGNVIHTTFLAAFTGTGRLSSREPNLQNIPTFGHWADEIKARLIPVRDGSVFVAADYSQIELRVLAHLSQEPRLLEAFRKGRDIHSETASWVFGCEPGFVTPEMRRTAKMINFGLLYGMSAFGLAERLDISRTEASGIIRRYFAALPGLENFLKEMTDRAMADGFTQTLAGRIRPLDEIGKNNAASEGRVIINTPIQGTAADIARRAMIDFDRAFVSDGDVHLFLQVHDSLVCECPEQRAEEVGQKMSEIMTGAASLSLPLKVQLKTGRSLAEV